MDTFGEKIKKGDRYYYTGDMANVSDFGTITEIISDKWGNFFSGKLDDGRIQRRVYLLMFQKGAGQRFKTMTQYNSERDASIKSMEKYLTKTA
jgi:hypothetical protein